MHSALGKRSFRKLLKFGDCLGFETGQRKAGVR